MSCHWEPISVYQLPFLSVDQCVLAENQLASLKLVTVSELVLVSCVLLVINFSDVGFFSEFSSLLHLLFFSPFYRILTHWTVVTLLAPSAPSSWLILWTNNQNARHNDKRSYEWTLRRRNARGWNLPLQFRICWRRTPWQNVWPDQVREFRIIFL